MLACILDVEGERLTSDERAFFRAADPWAFILFKRSCKNPDQMRALTAEIRAAVGRDALIFIDQEGGRVARLGPPHWRSLPPIAHYGRVHPKAPEDARRMAWLHHRIIAQMLRDVGVTADCAPCLDLAVEGASSVIGDRAFSPDPDIIADLGRAAMEGLHVGGVASVIKHIPGHGRAESDSHFELPTVDAGQQALVLDLAPFIALSDAPMAMTAHILFETWDDALPATQSPAIIQQIIRGQCGFDGLLMSDDASMKALSGSLQDRARLALAAGCDVAMLCNATLEDRLLFAAACPDLSGKALMRAHAAQGVAMMPKAAFSIQETWREFDDLLRTYPPPMPTPQLKMA